MGTLGSWGPSVHGARQFYWKLRHLERALLKNMHVDKRPASTAFIVDIWGKGMIIIIDWVWLGRLPPVRSFTLFFNTNRCENVPSDWRTTPAFDSQRRLLSSWIIYFFLAASPPQTSHAPLTGKWGPHSRSSKKLPKKKRDHALVLQTPTLFSGLTLGVFSRSTGPWNRLFTLIGKLHGHTFFQGCAVSILQFHGGTRSFRDFTGSIVPVHFIASDAKKVMMSICNVQPHVTDSTAMDNKWLVKASKNTARYQIERLHFTQDSI